MTRPAGGPAQEPPAGPSSETWPLHEPSDIVRVRHRVRELSAQLGFDIVLQTKAVTATSELARNTVEHGGGGRVDIVVETGDGPVARRPGLVLDFVDAGPGIADIDRALTSGWSSAGGLGLGLPGARALVHEFDVTTAPGDGTRVHVCIWRRR